jgi:hypothetical protein
MGGTQKKPRGERSSLPFPPSTYGPKRGQVRTPNDGNYGLAEASPVLRKSGLKNGSQDYELLEIYGGCELRL